MSQGATRLLFAVAAIPVFVAAVWYDRLVFYFLVQLVLLLGVREAFDLLKAKNTEPQQLVGYVFALAAGLLMYDGGWSRLVPLILVFVLIVLITELFRNRGSATLNIAATVFGSFYVTLTLGCVISLRNFGEPGGIQLIFLIFGGIWACDSLAYYGGRLFGKHKLFERVSPKKTWEGAFAGMLGGLLGVWIVRTLFVQFDVPFILSLPQTLVVGVFAGTLGQIGDLAESLLKRDAQIKDSSALIPGHGGILDRFDSTIFVAPATLIYLQYFIH